MKFLKKSILLFCAINILSIASVSAAPSWRGQGKIIGLLFNYHNAGVSLKFDNSVSINGCPVTNEIIVNRNLDGYADIYSALLTAFTTGNRVDIWVSGTCQNNRNVGTAFSVQ